MILKRVIAVITAVFSVLLAGTPLPVRIAGSSDVEHKYVIIQDADNEETVSLITELYGRNDPENEIMYAIGVCGPLLLTDSPDVIADKTERAFELAFRHNIPVWFQIDDVNNQYYAYCGESCCTADRWYENPGNVEKLSFGADALPAPYWFNWGSWKRTPAMPCLNSPDFTAFIRSQLENGFLPVLKKWTDRFEELGKGYLFAGVSVGWETRIPDYTEIPDGTVDQNGVEITKEEQSMTGYRALENLGYNDESSLKKEAVKRHVSEERLRFDLLSQVAHDYSEMISKEIFDTGVEKTKIFTHYVTDGRIFIRDRNLNYNSPPVSAAVNDYSTPGFTNGSDVSLKRLAGLKTGIARADSTQKHYGIVEGYAAGLNSSKKETLKYFNRLFTSGAVVVAVYGIHDAPGSVFEVPKTVDAPFTQAVRELTGK